MPRVWRTGWAPRPREEVGARLQRQQKGEADTIRDDVLLEPERRRLCDHLVRHLRASVSFGRETQRKERKSLDLAHARAHAGICHIFTLGEQNLFACVMFCFWFVFTHNTPRTTTQRRGDGPAAGGH